jgi:hypothetical protein
MDHVFEAGFGLGLPMFLITLGLVFLVAYIALIVYIYNDARRRGMNYVLWTLLAIFAPSAIGIILYFILRQPMPVFCTNCGGGMPPGLTYCPHCGTTLARTCPQCHRASQAGWAHCGWCGARL